MKVNEFKIITKNLINKYNNSMYESYDNDEDEFNVVIEMYNAS
ncbi:MAG: hypothetical protein ACP5N1_03135 [Candidatus Woesearchaeota archaeon]